MTVRDFKNVLIEDSKLEISVQTTVKGSVEEVYNTQTPFGGASYENIADKDIKFIKIDKKTIYIII